MPDLPPYVETRAYLRVRAVARGKVVDAVAWAGGRQRVYLRRRSDLRQNVGWVRAADVERT